MKALSSVLLATLMVIGGGVDPVEAKTMRLTSRAEALPKDVLTRLCARGLVALIETNDDGTSRQVILFSVIPVPPERVFDVLMDVEAYPTFLNTVDSTRVLGRRHNVLGFAWTLEIPLITLKGTRLQRGLRPKLVQSRGRSGDLRGTRDRWELYPVPGGTLVAFYRALDIETGGFVLRTLVDMEPSAESGANLSSAFIHLRGLEQHLAGKAASPTEVKARSGPVPPLRPLDLQDGALIDTLSPLLEHGQLAIIESHADGTLRQIALLGAARTSAARFREVVADPAQYPRFMPNISRQKVTKLPDGDLKLDWTISTPVSSISGVALMRMSPDAIDIEAIDGDVERSRMRWHFLDRGPKRAVTIYYSYSDIRQASWLTRQLLKAEPLLEHGMVAAAGTVAMTAMSARAEGRR